jgi:hypothetical protein
VSKRTDAYFRNVPLKPYDLLREGLIVFVVIVVVIVVLAAVFSSPDYPTVRGEDVADNQPVAYVKTSADILAGNSSIQEYGPPYTSDTASAQSVFGIAPARWFGVRNRIDPIQELILEPLARVAVLNSDVAAALEEYKAAGSEQQQEWLTAYLSALGSADVVDGNVEVAPGDYGPVPVLMKGMLDLGRAGLLEGALQSNAGLPYTLDFTRSMLFFQDDVYAGVAEQLDLLGSQWGISNETGRYPGAWWLWPYTFFYQIPPMSSSHNADLQVGVIMTAIFLLLLIVPFIPVLNRLPRWLGVHRLIWRDWYAGGGARNQTGPGSGGSGGPKNA